MSVKPMNDTADRAPAGPEEASSEQPHSWLAALRARLGLPGAPTLRVMLEDALKGTGDDRAFSAEEREMLLELILRDVEALDQLGRVDHGSLVVPAAGEQMGEQRLEDGETLGCDGAGQTLSCSVVLG